MALTVSWEEVGGQQYNIVFVDKDDDMNNTD